MLLIKKCDEKDLKLAGTNSQIKDLKNQLAALKDKNANIKDRAAKAQRKIASIQDNFRQNLGKKIAKRLSEANLNVYVDPHTGNVILRMDESFLFKRNSAILSKGAKRTLRKVIPLYVDTLFKEQDIADKINTINIIGHASPTWRQIYINPEDILMRTAYNYNLDLSSDRARSIVKYIFSRNFGKFKYKSTLRNKVQAIGKSFSEPVKRTPASKKADICGKDYDCKLSRRVEISFTLKDNLDAWNKVQKKP